MNVTQEKYQITEARSSYRYYAWLVIGLCAAFLFYKYILQVSPSVMTDDLMREFHVAGAGLGNLAATFFYVYLVTQLFVGMLYDKYSARFLSAFAIASSAVGAYLFSHAQSLWVAEAARGLMGFGAAFATVCYMKMAAVWFKPEQFAFVGGLLATAAMLGAVFGEAPLAFVVDHSGWRHSLFLCAMSGFGIALLFLFFVRDNSTETVKQGLKLKDFLQVFKNKQNWLITFYSGLAFSPVAVFGGLWGNPFLDADYHLTHTDSASLISLAFMGLAVGGPLLGYISDRLGQRHKVMKYGNFTALLSLALVLYYPHLPLWLLSALLFLFGFGTGAFMLGFALGKELNKAALAATVIALINTGDAIFGAFSEPLVGKFLDLGWSGKIVHGAHHFSVHDFHAALLLLPSYLILANFLLLFVKETRD